MPEETRTQMTKLNKCKFSHPILNAGNLSHACVREDRTGRTRTDEETCEACGHFRSRYIEFPITVTKIEQRPGHDLYANHVGSLCEIRLAGDEHRGKTFLGILLGELQRGSIVTHNSENGVLCVIPDQNPAIFVPELKRVVWGCESWWRRLEPRETPSGISDKDIRDTWYVKLMQEMLEPKGDDKE